MRRSFVLTSAIVCLPLALGATSALAQEKTAAEYEAQGKAALASGDVNGACTAFEQGYQVASKAPPDAPPPNAGDLLFDLADCHEKQGYGSLAASEFTKVEEMGGANAQTAHERAAKLKAPPDP